jgi:hypothetical protein
LATAFPLPTGQTKISEEIRRLIRRMKSENPSWGAPGIHGELLLLGFQFSELHLLAFFATPETADGRRTDHVLAGFP